jgi:hypothetical protein
MAEDLHLLRLGLRAVERRKRTGRDEIGGSRV